MLMVVVVTTYADTQDNQTIMLSGSFLKSAQNASTKAV